MRVHRGGRGVGGGSREGLLVRRDGGRRKSESACNGAAPIVTRTKKE